MADVEVDEEAKKAKTNSPKEPKRSPHTSEARRPTTSPPLSKPAPRISSSCGNGSPSPPPPEWRRRMSLAARLGSCGASEARENDCRGRPGDVKSEANVENARPESKGGGVAPMAPKIGNRRPWGADPASTTEPWGRKNPQQAASFSLFCDYAKKAMTEALEDKSSEECDRILARRWRALTDRERKKYEDMHKMIQAERINAYYVRNISFSYSRRGGRPSAGRIGRAGSKSVAASGGAVRDRADGRETIGEAVNLFPTCSAVRTRCEPPPYAKSLPQSNRNRSRNIGGVRFKGRGRMDSIGDASDPGKAAGAVICIDADGEGGPRKEDEKIARADTIDGALEDGDGGRAVECAAMEGTGSGIEIEMDKSPKEFCGSARDASGRVAEATAAPGDEASFDGNGHYYFSTSSSSDSGLTGPSGSSAASRPVTSNPLKVGQPFGREHNAKMGDANKCSQKSRNEVSAATFDGIGSMGQSKSIAASNLAASNLSKGGMPFDHEHNMKMGDANSCGQKSHIDFSAAPSNDSGSMRQSKSAASYLVATNPPKGGQPFDHEHNIKLGGGNSCSQKSHIDPIDWSSAPSNDARSTGQSKSIAANCSNGAQSFNHINNTNMRDANSCGQKSRNGLSTPSHNEARLTGESKSNAASSTAAHGRDVSSPRTIEPAASNPLQGAQTSNRKDGMKMENANGYSQKSRSDSSAAHSNHLGSTGQSKAKKRAEALLQSRHQNSQLLFATSNRDNEVKISFVGDDFPKGSKGRIKNSQPLFASGDGNRGAGCGERRDYVGANSLGKSDSGIVCVDIDGANNQRKNDDKSPRKEGDDIICIYIDSESENDDVGRAGDGLNKEIKFHEPRNKSSEDVNGNLALDDSSGSAKKNDATPRNEITVHIPPGDLRSSIDINFSHVAEATSASNCGAKSEEKIEKFSHSGSLKKCPTVFPISNLRGSVGENCSHVAEVTTAFSNGTSSPPEPLKSPRKRSPRVPKYPARCPVWFDMRRTKPCFKFLEASNGVVKGISSESSVHEISYLVERTQGGDYEARRETLTIAEDELAFAVHCPVLVRAEEGEESEVEGEVINVKPVIGEDGKKEVTYAVMVVAGGGRSRVEEGVSGERIRYKLDLWYLQTRIRDVTLSPRRSRKGVAIRTNERGEPMLNRSPPEGFKMKKGHVVGRDYSEDRGGNGSDKKETGTVENGRESLLKPAGIDCPSDRKRKRRKRLSSYAGLACIKSNDEVRMKQPSVGYYKFEGDAAQGGGVCIRHRAKIQRTGCSHEGCTNNVRKGGVCHRHGARSQCSHEGCTNNVRSGGVCNRHGRERCANLAQTGGISYRDDAALGTERNALAATKTVPHGNFAAAESIRYLRKNAKSSQM